NKSSTALLTHHSALSLTQLPSVKKIRPSVLPLEFSAFCFQISAFVMLTQLSTVQTTSRYPQLLAQRSAAANALTSFQFLRLPRNDRCSIHSQPVPRDETAHLDEVLKIEWLHQKRVCPQVIRRVHIADLLG